MPVQMTPQFDKILFTEIYGIVDDFVEDYNNIGIPTSISSTSVTTLFYLLYARYGNSPIANFDITQWKYKLFSIIFQYGPTWEKRLDVQKKIRDLDDDELKLSFKAVFNHAYNPSTAPSTSSLEELTYINDQNTNTATRGKLDAYKELWAMLDTDVTEEFIVQFKPLFKVFVAPERPLIYVTDYENEEADII